MGQGTSQGGVKPEMDQSTDENPKPCPENTMLYCSGFQARAHQTTLGSIFRRERIISPDSASVFSPRRGWRLNWLHMVLLQISDLTARDLSQCSSGFTNIEHR